MPTKLPKGAFVAAVALLLLAVPPVAVGSPAGAAPSGLASFHLDRVSCTSPTFCMAVGSHGHRMNGIDNSSKTLIERWNGSKWSIVSSPTGTTAGGGTALRDVSCTGPKFCLAVGSRGTKAFTMDWNGSKWAIETSNNPPGLQYDFLNGVSCTSSANCVAVGQQYTPDGRGPTLMERWNGKSWSLLPAPTPEGNNPVVFNSISCPQATNCYAVGSFDLGGPGEPSALALHWNGTRFTLAFPGTATALSALSGVACVSPPNCTAVGWSQTVNPSFGPIETFVLRWNGTKWSRRVSPSPGSVQSYLTGVSCISTSQCTAVGDFDAGSGEHTLVEQGNGTAWSQVVSPNAAPPADSSLGGVSCRSATSCIAVGHTTLAGGTISEHFNTLAEKWNGTIWTIVPGPQPSAS